jgi:hypothetical protein
MISVVQTHSNIFDLTNIPNLTKNVDKQETAEMDTKTMQGITQRAVKHIISIWRKQMQLIQAHEQLFKK